MSPATTALVVTLRMMLLFSVASFRMWLVVSDATRSLRPKRFSRGR